MKPKYKVRTMLVAGSAENLTYTPVSPGKNWELIGVSFGKETYSPKGQQLIEIWKLDPNRPL